MQWPRQQGPKPSDAGAYFTGPRVRRAALISPGNAPYHGRARYHGDQPYHRPHHDPGGAHPHDDANAPAYHRGPREHHHPSRRAGCHHRRL